MFSFAVSTQVKSEVKSGLGLFRNVSFGISKLITQSYSTSFSLGIRSLHERFHDPIYGIYGFVRLADEIVDSFHGFDQRNMLKRLAEDTWRAIDDGISTNPVLHAFQEIVRVYEIDRTLIEAFLHSMELDLDQNEYERPGYDEYIYGSAEVVGLMCLKIFTEGDDAEYKRLTPSAKRLGAAFQKVNFLRDLKADYEDLGRMYFPGIDFESFTEKEKDRIEQEISADFAAAKIGIEQLPDGARFGVYLAYVYYQNLFRKIKTTPATELKGSRIRVSNPRKVLLLARSFVNNAVGVL